MVSRGWRCSGVQMQFFVEQLECQTKITGELFFVRFGSFIMKKVIYSVVSSSYPRTGIKTRILSHNTATSVEKKEKRQQHSAFRLETALCQQRQTVTSTFVVCISIMNSSVSESVVRARYSYRLRTRTIVIIYSASNVEHCMSQCSSSVFGWSESWAGIQKASYVSR